MASPAAAVPAYRMTGDLVLNLGAGAFSLIEPINPPGPFDGVNPSNGKDWIPENVRQRVQQQIGQNKPGQAAKAAQPSPPPSPPAGGGQ
jgi:hypothetical protein